MKPVRLLFLLLGVICFLPEKTLGTPLYEQDPSKVDDLDDDWFSEYAKGRSYRVDKPKEANKEEDAEEEEEEEVEEEEEEEGEEETEGHEAATEPKKEDSASGGNKASETGKVESKRDEPKKPEGFVGSSTSKEAGASSVSSKPKRDQLNADVANGKGFGGENKKAGEAEEEDEEEEEEEEEEEDEEKEEEEEGDEEEEDDDDDEEDEDEDIQEIDKSERSNVAAGGAKVSYTKATAYGVEVSEIGITEDPAHFPDHIPEDAKRLMQNYQTWAASRTGGAAPSEPRNPLLAQSSGRPGTSTGTPTGTSAGAGGRPIILPIVFVPFDMRTNRVNMPAQMQWHPSGRQSQGYGPPPSGRPHQVYGQPPAGYTQSPQGYDRPPPSYGRPSPGQPLPQQQGAPNPRDLQLLVVPVER